MTNPPTTDSRAAWPAPPPPRPENSVFFGPGGLRAGWGVMLFVVLTIFLVVVFSAVLPQAAPVTQLSASSHSHPASPASPVQPPAPPATSHVMTMHQLLIDDGMQLVATGLATLLLALIERRRMRVYGIAASRMRDLLPGAFWGLACMSLLIAGLRAAHLLVFDARTLAGLAMFSFGGRWLLVFLLVGIFEEYLFRGYLQYTLTRGFLGLARKLSPERSRALAFWIAAVLMSVIFGLLHLANPSETGFGVFAVFLAGLVFSYALWRTGSLWWAIGFHMAWDWAQSFLYGVPDSGELSVGRLFLTHPAGRATFSGGIDGPEGSVWVLPVFLLIAVIIRYATRPGAQPPLEPQTMAGADPQEANSNAA